MTWMPQAKLIRKYHDSVCFLVYVFFPNCSVILLNFANGRLTKTHTQSNKVKEMLQVSPQPYALLSCLACLRHLWTGMLLLHRMQTWRLPGPQQQFLDSTWNLALTPHLQKVPPSTPQARGWDQHHMFSNCALGREYVAQRTWVAIREEKAILRGFAKQGCSIAAWDLAKRPLITTSLDLFLSQLGEERPQIPVKPVKRFHIYKSNVEFVERRERNSFV